ncbi:putative recombination protein [Escherichia coli M056]|uniref:recombination protein NinB n=1 Tax=Escherichia coli TaxID=562 RepID=UPI000A186D18|nr:recombination protein NinB [Escherichia coli]OSK23649.1 putative recombination protein [Escherichia coli M056]
MSVKFFLRDERVRRNLIDYIMKQPTNADFPLVVTLSDPQRTLPQNALFHALCGEISSARIQWAGLARSRESWKSLLVSGHAVATGKPGEVVAGLEGELVAVRESTSQMGIKRMNSLIEYTQAFAVSQNVNLREVRYSGDYFGRIL